ncbi:zinc finger protein GIS3-like [Syzygium oleosum]|uniref:zinc finger protein GIS3-like n=1 Tax=Syzygium oleosum TaxID=219896 RepID=UPI0024BBD327|nr:zinc finger protein GIS3-like [Syzygium oleosum]
MEQAKPLSKGKSLATRLSGDAGGKAARISSPFILEAKLYNDDHCGSTSLINLLNSFEKDPQKKPEPLKRNFDNTLATRSYCCKHCKARFNTLQSLGGHQNAHKRERAAKKRARVMNRIVNAFSQVTLKSKPNCSGMQANPVPRHPTACGPRARPSSADVVGPTHRGPPEPITMTNPRASVSHRLAMVNQLNGTVYEPRNNGDPNFCTGVFPQSTGPRPPPLANVVANGSSFSTQGLENEGLDLTLRL